MAKERFFVYRMEAPGLVYSFSLDVFFNLADALEIDPAVLISSAVFPDKVLKGRKDG